MSFNPEDWGARCSECFLRARREGVPVDSELHETAKGVIVGEFPKDDELRVGRPLVGPAGQEMNRGLQALGLTRSDFSYVHALSCRPPKNDLDRILREWQKENKARKKNNEDLLPHPIDCCKPRLLTEIRAHASDGIVNVITFGKQAAQSVTGHSISILDSRGGPINGVLNEKGQFVHFEDEEKAQERFEAIRQDQPDAIRVKLLPTLHPDFVIRMRRWTKAFRADLGRAVRWFGAGLDWKDPTVHWNPTPAFVREFLFGNGPDGKKRFKGKERKASVDIECAPEIPVPKPSDIDYDPLTDRIRCIGVSDDEEGIVVHFMSVDEKTQYYTEAEIYELVDIFVEFLADTSIVKEGHNFINYDATVLAEHFGELIAEFRQKHGIELSPNLFRYPYPIEDSMIKHKGCESELPHRLAYVGSVYTDTPSWKVGNTAKEARTDHDLGVYNVRDCVVVARASPKLDQVLNLKKQHAVVEKDHQVMEMCRGLHKNGLYIDQDVRRYHDVRLLKAAQKWQARIRSLVKDKQFKPGSPNHIRDLFYERWGLAPPAELSKKVAYTKSGLPSTSDDVILAFRMSGKLTREQLMTVEAIRKFRKAVKERGTFVMKPRPKYEEYALDDFSIDADDIDEDDAEAQAEALLGARNYADDRLEKDKKKKGMVLRDGRIHPDYGLGPNTGRISSSGWNALNITLKVRDMVKPAPGNVLVYADMDQIQLRIISWFSQALPYLEVFDKGGDAHAVSAEAIFREKWRALEKDSPDWEAMRKFAKTFTYNAVFGGEILSLLNTIRSTEDDDGNLIYSSMTEREVQSRYESFLERIPLKEWWDFEMKMYEDNGGWLADPLWGRRRDFADGEDRNAILCYRTQATESCIVHESEFEIMNFIPFGKYGHGTGMVHEGYDSIMVEVPAEHAEYAKGVVEHAMNRSAKGFGVKFTAKAKIIGSWYSPICKNKACKKKQLLWKSGGGYVCPMCKMDYE